MSPSEAKDVVGILSVPPTNMAMAGTILVPVASYDGGFSVFKEPTNGLIVELVTVFSCELKDSRYAGCKHPVPTPSIFNFGMLDLRRSPSPSNHWKREKSEEEGCARLRGRG
uniref:Uncharacterized protein n=1 Tax=Nelumbo nucifera TaxID=4432 RepID=A0A822YAR8_NELNU|nr:TPA_asm: hypothetical protein HUJ06_029644 [Nelumbo nucifera]